jgi:hypothetical protein
LVKKHVENEKTIIVSIKDVGRHGPIFHSKSREYFSMSQKLSTWRMICSKYSLMWHKILKKDSFLLT